MKLTVGLHSELEPSWPRAGRHIMAQYDDRSLVVYQAYRPALADYAVKHQRFGGEYSFSRMSWVKPNFLWMMYRCGWATKPDQERVLAVRIERAGFDQLLEQAVYSSFGESGFATEAEWKEALQRSEVRLQWDPDHSPSGGKLERRAIQLGMSGATLRRYATEWIVEVEDMSPFVATQRGHLVPGYPALSVPAERPYRPASEALCRKLGLAG
jgi:hypothetical protein